LAVTGSAVAEARVQLVASVEPAVRAAYDRVAERSAEVTLAYQCSWTGSLADALAAARTEDLRRGVTTIGPHRDDLAASIGALPSRSHASQGEQRSLALALRLAGHHQVTEVLETPPVLLLDDVFSELDPERSEALLASLPAGQVLLSTAGPLPSPARPETVIRIEDGKVLL
jgi:DNA replication and repair protein RecF